MCFRTASILAISIAALGIGSTPAVAQMSDEEIIANATSAAPEAVARDAAVVAMNEKMEMRTVREGKNNFTCMPDNPMSPGNDPMCLDEGGMQWAHAWMTKQQPPAGLVGFGYMLMGGS